ncbi:WD repeat-containing protein 19 [Armadillidium vulgare]|nr:WD repeat-containing protein 19 [Armadillidium vulgare]
MSCSLKLAEICRGLFGYNWIRSEGEYIRPPWQSETGNTLQGLCSGFGWDKDGALLAIINDRSPLINVWDANSGRVQQLDSGLKDNLSFLAWSKTAPLLAVGTAKGNLMIYNHQSSRRIPIVGKHSRRITCGCWSNGNFLALGGDDKILTISNHEGDTLKTAPLRGEPSDVQFSEMKTDERSLGDNTVSSDF